MNWRAADKVATWKVFKRRMEVIFVADQIPEERQWALILVAGGDEAYNCWDTLEDTVKDRKVVKEVWDAFEKSFEQSTSFWHFRDTYLADKEFAKFLSGLGIKHTTSSPGYPHSNGFIERHIQTVKNMLSKSSNTRSFQEVLADLRTTRIGAGLPSPAEILHGRNLTTRAQAEIDIKAIRSVLQERQLKMMLDHDSSRRAKKARPLVVGERCHVLGPGNKWIDAFVTGITDSGRSYETQVEATGKQFTRA